MKKLIAVPAIAILAAAGAASAAGFAGGVSAGPVQSGSTDDLTCAHSAKVVEWGTNDHLNPPNVVNARVRLDGASCEGQALHVMSLTPGGTQGVRASSGIIAPQAHGTQYARVTFETPIAIEDLNAVRITVDPGYAGLPLLPTS